MHSLRRDKLRTLLSDHYKGNRGQFLKDTGLTAGRLSQLLDPAEPFGDTAARNLEQRLHLEPGYFDAMDARTLRFATSFERLPGHLKDRWEELVRMLGGEPPTRG
jgi:hypothetical protein